MPRKTTSQLNAIVTAQEYAACKKAASRSGIGLAEFIRQSVKANCEAQGIEYPDNLVRRGAYDRATQRGESTERKTP